jgi:hypothetical protein
MNIQHVRRGLVFTLVGTTIALAITSQAQADEVDPAMPPGHFSKQYSQKMFQRAPVGYGALATERWRGALFGDWKAQNNLGLMLAVGIGAPKDVAKALYWMKRAAQNRRAKGPMDGAPETTLGWWYLSGEHAPAIPVDDARALYWNKLGAEQGHPNAIVNLALMYATGLGVEQSYDKTASLLIGAVEVFGRAHMWVLEEEDDWATFSRAKVPEEYMELKGLYRKAIEAKRVFPEKKTEEKQS